MASLSHEVMADERQDTQIEAEITVSVPSSNPTKSEDSRYFIDNAMLAMLEIFCDDLDLGSRTEFHCDPDSSVQHCRDLRNFLEKPLKKQITQIAVSWLGCGIVQLTFIN